MSILLSKPGPIVEESITAVTPPPELLARLVRNGAVMFSSTFLVRVLNAARGIILARLLLPEDFGLFGLASLVTGLAAVLAEVGAGTFLIYTYDDADQHADTAFWFNLVVATLLASGVTATAPLMASLYARPDLVRVLVVLAVVLWLQTLSTVHGSLLRRQLRFPALGIIDALVNIASFVAAVALAWNGYGVWAFVLSALIASALRLVLLGGVSGWLPRWRFSRSSLAVLASFSGWYLAQAVLWYFVLNMDNLLVGKFLGMTALGVYGVAYNNALLPVTLIASPLGLVAFPELARLRAHPSQFWAAFYQVSRLLTGVMYPVAAALLVAAPDLFPVLLGSKWNGAIVPFQILVVYGAVRCLWADPLGALGRFDLSTWLALPTSVVGVFAIYAGLHNGIVGVAWAVLVVVGGTHVAALYIGSRSGEKLAQGLRNAAPHLLAAGSGMAVALLVRYVCARLTGDRPALLALVSITTIFGVYGLIFRRHALDLAMTLMDKAPRSHEQHASDEQCEDNALGVTPVEQLGAKS